jgi:anti-anti-sigma regulatory factor
MVRMKPQLTRLLNRHPKVLVLDLKATQRVELAGLGILVDRLRRGGNGSRFQFSNVSPAVHRTLIRAGVDGLVGCA